MVDESVVADARPQTLFVAQIHNSKIISSMLSSILFKKDQTVHVSLTHEGIRFTSEHAKALQASVLLKKEIFFEFTYNSRDNENTNFAVNLTVLLQCLNVFSSSKDFEGIGPQTALRIVYLRDGEPLVLILEEGGVMTDCAIRTIECEDPMDFGFRTYDISARVVLASDALKDAYTEMEFGGSKVDMLLTGDPDRICFSSQGAAGTVEVLLEGGSEAVSQFKCEATVTKSYRKNLVHMMLRALSISHETCIRVNEIGMLSHQNLVRSDEAASCFVEFFICAEEDSDEEGY